MTRNSRSMTLRSLWILGLCLLAAVVVRAAIYIQRAAPQPNNRQRRHDTAPQPSQCCRALVIGNGPYKNVKALKNTPNDASRLARGQRLKSFKSQQGIEMVYVPRGRFMMGSTNGDADEKSAHEVTISQAFYMGKYEVTQGQWHAVMGSDPSNFKGNNLPVETVSGDDAIAFIARLNEQNDGYSYRLPSEAEWEYACRAGASGDYAGDLDAMGWYGDNSGRARLNAAEIWRTDSRNYKKRIIDNGNRTHAVGTKVPNSLGLFDMHGNVWEWCQDWYHDSYYGAPTDGSAWLGDGQQKYRVLRGGSWNSDAPLARSAYRGNNVTPDTRLNYIGFRVVAVVRTQ